MKLLSTNELAAALGVSREKLRAMAKAGQLPPALLVGKTKRYVEADVEKFLREQTKNKETV